MKKAEIVLVLLALIAVVLRLLSIEGGVFLSTLSFGILSFFYLLLAFLLLNNIPLRGLFKKQAYRDTGWKRLLWAVLTGIVLMLGIPGILFVLNRWEGASLLIRTGALLLLSVFVISLIRYIPKPSRYHAGILIRSGILLLTSILLILFR